MRARRTDSNHSALMADLRKAGFRVRDTSAVGQGFPDLVIFRPDCGVLLVEVKDGDKPPSRRKLTAAELEFARDFPVIVATRLEDIVGDPELWRRHL